jgi:hypothetical protein
MEWLWKRPGVTVSAFGGWIYGLSVTRPPGGGHLLWVLEVLKEN